MMPPSLFERDQIFVSDLLVWNGQIVARADPHYAIDVSSATSTPIILPGNPRLRGFATHGGNAAVLCRQGSRDYVAEWSGQRWAERAVPPEPASDEMTPAALGADARELVVWQPGHLHRLIADTWTTTTIRLPPGADRFFPMHALLANGRLYLGEDKGEWGGALYSIDVATGQWRQEGDSSLPVHAIALGPDRNLWVARGLAHLGLRQGQLEVLAASADRFHLVSSAEQGTSGVAWPLPATSFDGLAFDGHGRLHLATGSLGLVRREGDSWKQVTTGWPTFVYVKGLVFAGDTAVIATFDGGVLLIDPATGSARRVTLARRP